MNGKIKRLGDFLLTIPWIRDAYIAHVFGGNTYDIGLGFSIEKDCVDKLMHARKIGIDYCVIYEYKTFLNYKPLNPYFISTRDIQIKEGPLTEDDAEIEAIERANIYWFMQGKVPIKSKEEYYERIKEEKKKEELKAMQEEQQKTQEPTMVK